MFKGNNGIYIWRKGYIDDEPIFKYLNRRVNGNFKKCEIVNKVTIIILILVFFILIIDLLVNSWIISIILAVLLFMFLIIWVYNSNLNKW